jgi:hypothetical protein
MFHTVSFVEKQQPKWHAVMKREQNGVEVSRK